MHTCTNKIVNTKHKELSCEKKNIIQIHESKKLEDYHQYSKIPKTFFFCFYYLFFIFSKISYILAFCYIFSIKDTKTYIFYIIFNK